VTGAVIPTKTQPPTKVQSELCPIKNTCDEDTYAKCVKVRSTPSSSNLPPKPAVFQQTILHTNSFSPLCIESNLLDVYECPLFTCNDDLKDHTSPNDVEPKQTPNVSPKKDREKTPLWKVNQSNTLRSTALGAGLRKCKKVKTRLPCMDSYTNVQPSVTIEQPSIIQINHIQFHPTTNVIENPVQTIAQDIPRVDEPRIKLQLTCEEDAYLSTCTYMKV
jgi:hypothetical protein